MFKYYLFEDYATDKNFVVNEPSLEQAYATAFNWFADPSYICELNEIEADAGGYDIF